MARRPSAAADADAMVGTARGAAGDCAATAGAEPNGAKAESGSSASGLGGLGLDGMVGSAPGGGAAPPLPSSAGDGSTGIMSGDSAGGSAAWEWRWCWLGRRGRSGGYAGAAEMDDAGGAGAGAGACSWRSAAVVAVAARNVVRTKRRRR